MKSFLFLMLFSLTGIITKASNSPVKEEVQFNCNVSACNKMDSVFLFEFNGITFRKVKAALTADYENYNFILPVTEPRVYFVGLSPNNLRPVILGSEKKVSLKGACSSFAGAKIPESNINSRYDSVLLQLNRFKADFSNTLRQYQLANSQDNVDQMNVAVLSLRELDKKRLSYLESLNASNPFLAHIAALNTYLSYQNNGTGDKSEIEYFATEYFRFADWKNKEYNYLPQVFESFRDYTQVLLSVGLPDEAVQRYIDQLLAAIPQGTRTQMLALGGTMVSLQEKQSPLMVKYAQLYVKSFNSTEPEATALLYQMITQIAGFLPGAASPDFTMNTPDGKKLTLSQLKGKYVLLDFWASWCGPCRAENPNVVKAYSKYKSKGFEILGVSLDQNQERWVDAIAKDGLSWLHVSDLKGWANDAARLYGVSSIPHTFLLDREGKIIAKNLRGEALWAKLREIFGE